MQYKRLEPDELNKLEEDFVNFLVINGIDAEQWQNILNTDELTRDKIIDQFSDVVWETSLRKAKYLEKRESHSIYCFACGEEEIKLIRIISESHPIINEDGQIDLRDDVRVQRASKGYQGKREQELFKMMEDGCILSDGMLYRQLDK